MVCVLTGLIFSAVSNNGSTFPDGNCMRGSMGLLYDKDVYGGNYCKHPVLEDMIDNFEVLNAINHSSSYDRLYWQNVSMLGDELPPKNSNYSVYRASKVGNIGRPFDNSLKDILNVHNCEIPGAKDPLKYNTLASLLLRPGSDAIKVLFQQGMTDIVPWEHLALAMVVYFFMVVITAGSSLPSGLVIPYVFMGGCLGR